MKAKENGNERRIKNSKLNVMTGFLAVLPPALLSFVERIVFNRCFIPDYLGLYNLFNNIMGMLSAAELGIGVSIAFALYEPIEKGDEAQISAIMRMYGKIFRIVGTIILIGGFVVMLFLPKLVNTSISIGDVRKYFVFFILKTVTYYFFCHKEILFSANQEQYKLTVLSETTRIATYLSQIAVALITRDFLYYSAVTLLIALVRYFLLNLMARKEFRFLERNPGTKIEKGTYRRLITNAKGMFITRLSSVFVSATDSLLVSALVGTALLGLYANYQMITSGLIVITVLIPRAVSAAIGSAGVTESKKTLSVTLMTLNTATFFIYSAMTVLIVSVFNPLISLLYGADRILPMPTMILLTSVFYFKSQRELLLTYKGSLGLYWADKIRPVAEGVSNLILSIIFGKFWGLNGILIGTLFSQICVNLAVEPHVIFRIGLNESPIGYYKRVIAHFLITFSLTAVSLGICSVIPLSGIPEIISNGAISLALTSSVLIAIYGRSDETKLILSTLKRNRNDNNT